MRPAQLRTRIFTDSYTRDASERALDRWLEALTQQDVDYLREHPDTPRLYDSGVRYYHSGRGSDSGLVDEWLDVPEAMSEGVADCKSLAAWLAAEYRVRGTDPGARCTKKFAEVDDPDVGRLLLYHVLTLRSDGSIEDPSRVLGMNQDEPDGYIPVPGVPWVVVNGMTNAVGAALLGNELALSQLEALRQRAERGDARAAYLIGVARLIRNKGYDPARSRWTRLSNGSWTWTRGDGE